LISTSNGADMHLYPTGDLMIMPSRYVGIGTTLPSTTLDVLNTSGVYAAARVATAGVAAGQSTGLIVQAGTNSSDYTLFTESQSGSTYLVVRGDGNVGIGTAIPAYHCTVEVPANGDGFVVQKTGGSFRGGILIAGADYGFLDLSDSATTSQCRLKATGDSYINGGNVGIGTTSPGAKLDIAGGDIRLQGSGAKSYAIEFANSTPTTKWHIAYYNGGLNFSETTIADYRLFLKDGGNVGIGTTNPLAKLHVKDGVIYADYVNNINFALNSSGSNYGVIQNDTANTWSLATKTNISGLGTPVLTWISSGNVGIGTTSPGDLLHVYGGNIQTNGQVHLTYPGYNDLTLTAGQFSSTIAAGAKDLVISASFSNSGLHLRSVGDSGSFTYFDNLPTSDPHVYGALYVGPADAVVPYAILQSQG
jgi:hypothetical protein